MSTNVISKEDAQYPRLLAELGDAPKQLYYQGEWDQELFRHCLAVVGTRRMTNYGKQMTQQIVGEAAQAGLTIVSGFMYGIDAEAHRAALGAGGKTIAVMPCGIDLVHPEYQADLYERILESGGLVVSEWEGTYPAMSWTFPRRNRIVAGFSQATLVVEAGEGSGALITAGFAKKYGRKVLAIPGSLTSPVSAGVTELLKGGATLVSAAEDVLREYGLRSPRPKAPKLNGGRPPFSLGAEPHGELEQRIVRELTREPADADALARRLGISTAQLNAAVSILEVNGFLTEERGKLYVS